MSVFHVDTVNCGRCGAQHNRIGQSYCHACNAAAQRAFRKRRKEERARLYDEIVASRMRLILMKIQSPASPPAGG